MLSLYTITCDPAILSGNSESLKTGLNFETLSIAIEEEEEEDGIYVKAF